MEALDLQRRPQKHPLALRTLGNERGIVLVVALLVSAAILAMVMVMFYVSNRAQQASGAGKRYSTAAEAADGAVDVTKGYINLTIWADPLPGIYTDTAACLNNAILNDGVAPCQVVLNLPGIDGNFTATVTVERLFSAASPGGRIEFARPAGGAPSMFIYYRITTSVVGPANSTAENSVLYRFAG